MFMLLGRFGDVGAPRSGLSGRPNASHIEGPCGENGPAETEDGALRGSVGAGLLALVALAALGAGIGPAGAQQLESAYTEVNLDACSLVESDDFGSRWACPGYRGIPVMIAEGDLRFFVSYGLTSMQEKAAGQTLPPFNHLGEMIEWRLSNAEGRWRPFATILRYVTAREQGDKEAQILVVTRLGEGATCHVAYIDATANPDANVLARKAADERARDFDCGNDAPGYVGRFEAWELE